MTITFTIKKHIGVISKSEDGWSKELNLISWNEATPKYDIRNWEPGREHMSRGITLHEHEVVKLYEILTEALQDIDKIKASLEKEIEPSEDVRKFRDKIPFVIVEPIGVIYKYPTGWSKEINLVSWDSQKAVFDIRDWNKEHSSMARGVTLTLEEIESLVIIIKEYNYGW